MRNTVKNSLNQKLVSVLLVFSGSLRKDLVILA